MDAATGSPKASYLGEAAKVVEVVLFMVASVMSVYAVRRTPRNTTMLLLTILLVVYTLAALQGH